MRLEYNPFSFLHIVNPGYRYAKQISGNERYKLVKNRYSEFKEDGVFVQDKKPSFYIYKIVDRDQQEFNGIVASASVEDYDAIKSIIIEKQKERAEFEFTTTYRDTHYLWQIDNEQDIAIITEAFAEMKTLYIADGHHRSSSSQLLCEDLRKSNPNHTGNEPYNFFMSYLISESELRLHEFNRLVKDLNGLSYKPSKPHHFSMYLDGEFYSLYLRKNNYTFKTSLDELDAQLLYKTILEPILGIKDLRKDKRIDYISGKKDIVNLKSKVDSGAFKVGFGMVPATIKQIKDIADDGLKMPPKSTYIEPKIRSGVTIYEF